MRTRPFALGSRSRFNRFEFLQSGELDPCQAGGSSSFFVSRGAQRANGVLNRRTRPERPKLLLTLVTARYHYVCWKSCLRCPIRLPLIILDLNAESLQVIEVIGKLKANPKRELT